MSTQQKIHRALDLADQIIPEVAGLLAGPAAEPVAHAVVSLAQSIVGVTYEAAGAHDNAIATLNRDGVRADTFRAAVRQHPDVVAAHRAASRAARAAHGVTGTRST